MSRLRIVIYEDAAARWRWRLVARNGRVMADSGEGYATRAGCLRALGVLATYAEEAFGEACVWPDEHTEAVEWAESILNTDA